MEWCARGALFFYRDIRPALPSTCKLLLFIELNSSEFETRISGIAPRYDEGDVVELLPGDITRAMVVGKWKTSSETEWTEPREIPSDPVHLGSVTHIHACYRYYGWWEGMKRKYLRSDRRREDPSD